MAINMQVPWKVSMSPVGPSIEYAGEYKFNSEVNMAANATTYRVAGPGQVFGLHRLGMA